MKQISITFWIVTFLGIIISIGLFVFASDLEYQQRFDEFEEIAEERAKSLEDEISDDIESLTSLAGLHYASSFVSRDEFRIFAASELKDRPSVQALEWIPRVPEKERKVYEDSARKDGFSQFQITERTTQGTMISGKRRSEYFPVFYVEPMGGNEAAFGFDLASNPTRLKALQQARDSGNLIASAPITLVQEKEKQSAFLVFLPVYQGNPKTVAERQKQLQGFYLGVFRSGDIIEKSFMDIAGAKSNLITTVFDESDSEEKVLIYPAEVQVPSANLVSKKFIFEIGGRTWNVTTRAEEEFFDSARTWQSYVMLAVGLLLTGTLASYIQTSTKQRVKSESVANELRQLIATANAPIFSVDTNGNVNEWNEMTRMITGYLPKEVLGKNLIEMLIPNEFKAKTKEVMNNALQGKETANYESPILTKEGKIIYILLNATSRKDNAGNIVGVVGIGQDITERRSLVKQLEKEHFNLEKAVDEKTRDLRDTLKTVEAAKIRLEEANKAKSKFLSTMGHELRTPLNAILGFTDLLQGQFFGSLNEKQIDYVDQINKSGQHLLSLINDLLDLAKSDAGAFELELENIPAGECLESIISMMSSQFNKKKLRVKTYLDPTLEVVVGDLRKLKQIMLNLLSNAVKFTPEKGEIKIALEKEEGQVKITVSDTGMGIAENELDKIFLEFHQAEKVRDEQLGGTGIGLTLTQKLVELHDGQIGVESELGKGSTF